jgi:hypothetical protein
MQAAVVLVVSFGLAQFIRPQRANPPIDPSQTFEAHMGTPPGLAAVVDRACRDCHTNATVWPWYSRIAPLSWLMAAGVAKGREAVNFSEWGSYSPARQRELLALICSDVSTGKMPGAWTKLHPEAELSRKDVETFCAAARQAEGEPSR